MEGVLTVQEQIPGEKFQAGDRIKVLVKRVRDSVGGTQVMLSRANYMFIKRLFENEVPEIRAEIVQIKNIVREAGFRTKMAVYSTDPDIDAVGACVGNKGARVNAIVSKSAVKNRHHSLEQRHSTTSQGRFLPQRYSSCRRTRTRRKQKLLFPTKNFPLQ